MEKIFELGGFIALTYMFGMGSGEEGSPRMALKIAAMMPATMARRLGARIAAAITFSPFPEAIASPTTATVSTTAPAR